MSKYKCKFQKQIDTEKVCEAFEANRYGDIICQEEDCQLCKLKAENERLREENYGLNQELLGYKKGVQAAEIIELKQTLKEIKAIAEAPKPFIDFSETKTATEVEYDYAAICNKLELRLHKICLQLHRQAVRKDNTDK